MMDAVMKRCGCNTCDTFFMDGRDEFNTHTEVDAVDCPPSAWIIHWWSKKQTPVNQCERQSTQPFSQNERRIINNSSFRFLVQLTASKTKTHRFSSARIERGIQNSIRFHSFKFLVNYKMHTQKRWTHKKEAMRGRSEARMKGTKGRTLRRNRQNTQKIFRSKMKKKTKTNCLFNKLFLFRKLNANLMRIRRREPNHSRSAGRCMAAHAVCVCACSVQCLRACVCVWVCDFYENEFIH